MDVDGITPALLTQTLRAWQQGQALPPQMLTLDLLPESTAVAPTERAFALQDLIIHLVTTKLARLRAAVDLPADVARPGTRQTALDALARDFRAGDAELQAWSSLYYRHLVPLPLRQEELAAAIPLDPRSFRRHVNAGLDHLAMALQRQEHEAHGRLRARARARHLPPPDYNRLFGIAAHQARLAQQLRDEHGPALISIEGLGGIGKTALARAVAFELAQDSDYDGIAWISARQSWLNERGEIEETAGAANSLADIIARLAAQLGLDHAAGLSTADKLAQIDTLLNSTRQLIVIDNLETISDIEAVLPALLPLAGPGRFLLTTRQAIGHSPRIQHQPVPPLSLHDSRVLLESEIARHGRTIRLGAADVESLYLVLGGLPLALKLIAGQIGRIPLDILLDGLRSAAQGPPQGLYSYIYRRIWLALDDPARHLLLSLLTIDPDGEDLSWLRMVSLLDEADFASALDMLLSYALLETAGSPASPTYRLHRLTTTFLQTDVLAGWNDGQTSASLLA
jgi:hypothetical protein